MWNRTKSLEYSQVPYYVAVLCKCFMWFSSQAAIVSLYVALIFLVHKVKALCLIEERNWIFTDFFINAWFETLKLRKFNKRVVNTDCTNSCWLYSDDYICLTWRYFESDRNYTQMKYKDVK